MKLDQLDALIVVKLVALAVGLVAFFAVLGLCVRVFLAVSGIGA